jgi:hypothetical protein
LIIYSALSYAVAVIASIPLFGLWNDSRRRRVKWFEVVIPIFIGLLLTPYCLIFYLAIPLRWGGGRPERKVIWVSSAALPILATCSQEAKQEMNLAPKRGDGHDDDLFPVEGLYLLHEKSASWILWSSDCPVILEVSKDLIKGGDWPDPQRRDHVQ